MVLGKKPVQVCEFFVGHGRVSHNAGIYRKLLILPRFRRAPMPVSFTDPPATDGAAHVPSPALPVFWCFSEAKPDGWRLRGALKAQIAARPLTNC
jgi:hypothetical protein